MATGETAPSAREKILEAALEIAGREGIGILTTRRVAEEAGVNLGLLHYYFKSKEALVVETIGLFIGELGASFDAIEAEIEGSEPEEELVGIFETILDAASRRPGIILGLISRLIERAMRTVKAGNDSNELFGGALPRPIDSLVAAETFLVGRVKALLSRCLGEDEVLLSRRALQLFISIFHPLLFTPVPRLIFGIDMQTERARHDYVRAVVADATRI
jgi:AcrR family transcriptional regulator